MSDSGEAQDSGRRDALKKIALGAASVTAFPILGQGAVPPAGARPAHLGAGSDTQCHPAPNWQPLFFDAHQNEMVVALTDLIIPETDTPGAKAAFVNRYIDLLLNEEDEARQRSFIEGLAWVDARSLRLFGKPFVQLGREQQSDFLTPLAEPENKNSEDGPGMKFFQEVKDLTLFGYYTSQVGMERELEYGGGDYHTEFPGACTHPEHQTG